MEIVLDKKYGESGRPCLAPEDYLWAFGPMRAAIAPGNLSYTILQNAFPNLMVVLPCCSVMSCTRRVEGLATPAI